jgi:hypothetical protein
LELFAVNHGVKESVQLFSISVRPDGAALQWRGCVEVEAILEKSLSLSNTGVIRLRERNFLHTIEAGVIATNLAGRMAARTIKI